MPTAMMTRAKTMRKPAHQTFCNNKNKIKIKRKQANVWNSFREVLVLCSRMFQKVHMIYILNEDTHPVIRAIGVSHTGCKDEFRRKLRSHSWNLFLFLLYDIPGMISDTTVAPVAYQVILEPGIGQLREFESPRVHTRIPYSLGLFSCTQVDLRKAREREIATFDEKSTSNGIAEPYARQKMKARTGGGGKGTRPVTMALPEAGKYWKLKRKLDP